MVTKDETNQSAEKSAERREKLKALRQKQQQQRNQGSAGTGGQNKAMMSDQAGAGPGRQKLRKLFEQRRRNQPEGGADAADSGARRGGKLRELMGAGKRNRGGEGGIDLEKFPRLLDAGRRKKGVDSEAIDASSTPQEITAYREQLQARADLLEKALDKTLQELDKVKKMESEVTAGAAEVTD